MATLLNPQEKDDEQQNNNAGPQQVTSGESSTIGSNTSTNAPGTKSGRFTNISNYLKANQGYNAQGGGLAGKIAGNIQNQGQEIKQQVGQAQNQFNEDANKNRVQYNENTANDALKNSAQFASNDENVGNFQKMLQAKYNGPQGLQNADSLQGKAQNLQNMTGQTTSEGGRFGLLKQMFNKPTYSGGQQKLDNLLLQGNQNQLKQLTGTRQVGNQVANTANSAQMNAVNEAQKFKDEAAATAQKTQEGLNAEQTAQQKQLEDYTNQLNSQRHQQQQDVLGGLANRQLSQQDISNLGLQSGQELYGVNLNNYLTQGGDVNKYQAANPEQYAKFAALAKLGGTDNTFLPSQYQDQAGKVGNAYDFDKSRLQNDIATNKATYERQIADQNTIAQDIRNNQFGGSGQTEQTIRDAVANGGAIQKLIYGQSLNDYDAALAQQDALKKQYGIGNTLGVRPLVTPTNQTGTS